MRKVLIFGILFLILVGGAFADETGIPRVFSPIQAKEEIRAAFQKGKNFYDQGRYQEAFREWDSVEPYLQGSSVKKVIDFLKSRIKESDIAAETPSGKTADSAPPPAELPSAAQTKLSPSRPSEKDLTAVLVDRTPDGVRGGLKASPKEELTTLLEGASQKLKKQSRDLTGKEEALRAGPRDLERLVQEANARIVEETNLAIKADKEWRKTGENLNERQKWIDDTLENGKSFYGKGELGKAIEELEKLMPYVDSGSKIRAQMDELKKNYRRHEKTREFVQEHTVPVQPSPDLEKFTALLLKTTQELKTEATGLETQKTKTDKETAPSAEGPARQGP